MDLAGSACHACGRDFGTVVDHDHFTGAVRGLLCTHCNNNIDKCPHLSVCRWADYLNSPPAEHLGIRHPDATKASSWNKDRIELMGFDPFPKGR
ncbi:endonuclease domain-containing protein [Actinokineospora inagensis]|uniref:endonuclease domain-containing protein n=1 Tax=Actinokineospora inagensis TaxID=103730 RepID=UPI00055728DA|nr:endonuclease domain-containing protein [Actinokineospora inagensis]